MQFLYDNLTAVVIGIVCLLIVVAVQIRAGQGATEQVATHAAKTKAMTFGQWLEDDVLSLGANFGSNPYRFEEPEAATLFGVDYTKTWTFFSEEATALGGVDRLVTRYRTLVIDTAYVTRMVDGAAVVDSLPRFQVVRDYATTPVVDGVPAPILPGAWTSDGRSVATLSAFEVGMLRRNGAPAASPDEADYIRLRFSMVPETGLGEAALRELFWTTTLKVRPFWEPLPSAGSGASS